MSNQLIRHGLVLATIPILMVTAAIAQVPQDTPSEESDSEQSEEKEDPAIARANRDKARYEAETAAFEARKAREEARAAAAASAFGPLSSYEGAKGEITVDPTERGKLEATLLSALAIQEAVEPLAADVVALALRLNRGGARRLDYRCLDADACDPPPVPPSYEIRDAQVQDLCEQVSVLGAMPIPPRNRPIVIVSEEAQGPAALAEAFDVRTAAMARELCRALEESDVVMASDTRGLNLGNLNRERGGGFSLPAASAALDVVGNLLRTDYEIFGISVTPDQSQLIREMAGTLLAERLPNPVYTPSLFPVGSTTDSNPALQRIALLDRLSAEAADAAARHHAAEGVIAQRALHPGANSLALSALKGDHERIKLRLRAAATAYGALLTEVTATTGGQPPSLVGIVRQANTAALLRRGGLLVMTKIHFQGGTAFSRQNFFSSMFGMPYRVSGGALVSSIVQDGSSGRVYQARVVPVSGGFHGPTQLRRVIEKAESERRGRRQAWSE
jgi:hypothetical protein